jgi:hypothetical protein
MGMTVTTAPYWSEVSGEARIGRRGLLILSAGAAAALLTAGKSLPLASPPLTPQQFVRALSKTRWGWNVELAVLHQYATDRRYALDLLWAALELDLDPAQRRQQRPAYRLYDLFAAASDASGRAALARLVEARSLDAALLARTQFWLDPARRRPLRVWHTIGPDRRPIGIVLNDA